MAEVEGADVIMEFTAEVKQQEGTAQLTSSHLLWHATGRSSGAAHKVPWSAVSEHTVSPASSKRALLRLKKKGDEKPLILEVVVAKVGGVVVVFVPEFVGYTRAP